MSRRKGNKTKDLCSHSTNVIDAAGELSIDPQTFRRYIREGCPATKRGVAYYVDVPECQRWMLDNGKSGKRGIHADDIKASESPTLEAVRIRKETALADKYEIQTKRERGKLVSVDAVQQWMIRHHTSARNYLLGLPAKAVVLLAGRNAAEQQSILDTLIREALETVADMADELESGLASA